MDHEFTTAASESEPIDFPFVSALDDKLGMRVLSATPERTVVTMPVEGNTQITGVLHGGATAALCEAAASLAANVFARTIDPSAVAVGSQVSISHIRPGRSGLVTGTAEATHLGRSTTVHRVDVTNQDDQIVSTALVTNYIVQNGQ